VRDGSYASTNFGAETDLEVKTDAVGWDRHSFLTFDLSSIGSSIASVKLRLFGNAGGEQVTVYCYPVATTNWPELSINWNNQPDAGSTALSFLTVTSATDAWYELDVTAYVQAEKAAGHQLVSFELANPNQNTQVPSFASREAASNWPELDVTVSG
jgi:hypothetical protein